jgi:hypothetical protein
LRKETEIKAHASVLAVDGRAGHLIGIAVDRDDHTVQQLLVRVGHLSNRRQVSVPFAFVTAIDEHGVHVNLSKDQVASSHPT